MRVRNLLAVWLTAVFVVSFSAYAENDTVNLARMSGVKCTASGTLDGYAPERVTDGADTEWISAWDSGEVQWIQIDLGEERKITQIVLTPRKNGYNPETTQNFKVYVSKTSDFNITNTVHTQGNGTFSDSKIIDVGGNDTYRYVRVCQTVPWVYFSFSEIEVIGYYGNAPEPERRESLVVNNALNKPVMYNEVLGFYSGCPASSLVDGSGAFAAVHGTTTNGSHPGETQYIIVDLGAVFEVSKIEIDTRTDSYNDMDLNRVKLVAEAESTAVTDMKTVTEVVSPGSGGTFEFIPEEPLWCRYIGLRRDSEYLMVAAEMRVFTELKESFGEWTVKKSGTSEYADGKITQAGNYTVILDAENYNTVEDKNYTMAVCMYGADGKLKSIEFKQLVQKAGSSYPLYADISVNEDYGSMTVMLLSNTNDMQMKLYPLIMPIEIIQNGD